MSLSTTALILLSLANSGIGQEFTDNASSMGCAFDIAFVLDRSESITERNFPLEVNMVKDIITNLPNRLQTTVGPTGVQVAMVPYNTYATVTNYFDEVATSDEAMNMMNSVFYEPGLSNPYDAFKKLINVFSTAKGSRLGAKKVVVFISDGMRTMGANDPLPLAEAFRAKQNGLLISVGVTGLRGTFAGYDTQMLSKLAGSQSNVFNVTSYDGIYNVLAQNAPSPNACLKP